MRGSCRRAGKSKPARSGEEDPGGACAGDLPASLLYLWSWPPTLAPYFALFIAADSERHMRMPYRQQMRGLGVEDFPKGKCHT